MTVDHRCLVKHCVNPTHFEIVTSGENSIRANRGKMNCRAGHPYAYHGFTLDAQGKRYCNTCRAETRRLRSEREKAERRANPAPSVGLRSNCSKGHEYTPENTYITPSTGNRACKECRRAFKKNGSKARNASIELDKN